ncbi:MAG TPA: plastocyanin/azurin family copper-binding protein [Candidatus Acidoferrales bacterium]|nr:plastocyanin/azurin family copper-binding protein [Candidatus Acidoferrales bacterium]
MTRRPTALRIAVVAGCCGGLFWLAGCGGAATPASPTPAKAIAGCTASDARSAVTVDATSSFRYAPAAVCLRVGGTVTWTNTTQNLDHTSTDEPSLAASAGDATIPKGGHGWNLRLPSGRSAHLTFKTAGVYHYFCIPHETLGMLGVIDVVR